MSQTILGLVRIVRPLNCVLFFAGTFVGGIVTAGVEVFRWPGAAPLVLAGLSAMLVGASGNVLNDVCDLEIDRINRPLRPLPAGQVTTRQARILWAVLTIVGVGLAVLVSKVHVAIAVPSVILLFAYSTRLKSLPLVGNVVVSVIVAAALIYGGLSVGGVELALPATVFAFLVTMARELLKDIEDLRGDATYDVSSFAVVKGADAATTLAVTILLLTIWLTVLPFILLDYSGMYLLLMMLANGLMLVAIWRAADMDITAGSSAASRWTKFAMVIGLAALAMANGTAT